MRPIFIFILYENQKQNYVQHVLSDCNPKLLITDDKEITTYKIKIENNVGTYLSSNLYKMNAMIYLHLYIHNLQLVSQKGVI